MKAENKQELLTGLKIMRNHLNILIEHLEKTFEFEKPRNKQFLMGITLDLRELYKSYYLDKKGEKK
jgi:hypothetical protein